MDQMCGVNPAGNQAVSGFTPGVPLLAPGLGLAVNRLGAPQASSATSPESNALMAQSLQLQNLTLQMMNLLLGLMSNQLGQGQAQSQGQGGASPIQAMSGGGGAGESGGASQSGGAGGAGGAGGPAPANDTKDQGEIKSYIATAAAAYGTDPKVLTEIARRESNFQAGAVNNWDSNAKKGTPSKGMFQFIEPTFKSYAASAKKANPAAWEGLGELNWLDWRQQALAASWAIKNGHGSAWATYKAAGGT